MMYRSATKNKILTKVSVLCCVSVLVLNGCATTTSKLNTPAPIDPYEDFNRTMFNFNEVLDEYVAEPIVNAYNWVTPHFVQTGIGNFFSNLKDVNVMLNNMMQGKFLQGGEDTGRFLLNSTVGIGGLVDVASEIGLEKHNEDFDQTLAVWGVPQGPYLILPLLGPTTGRGIGGHIFDTAANPATYVGYPIQAISLLNERANADSALKIVDEAALDRYIFIREAFLQTRQNLITDGKASLSEDLLDSDSTESTDKPKKAPLNANPENFKKALDNFSNTEKSLEKANRSLKKAADKLERLTK